MADDDLKTHDPFSVLEKMPINPDLQGKALHPTSDDDYILADDVLVSLNTRVKRRYKRKLEKLAEKNKVTLQTMVERLIERA